MAEQNIDHGSTPVGSVSDKDSRKEFCTRETDLLDDLRLLLREGLVEVEQEETGKCRYWPTRAGRAVQRAQHPMGFGAIESVDEPVAAETAV